MREDLAANLRAVQREAHVGQQGLPQQF